ncbi:hypothetical protein CEXT_346721 [Caerostris extrusa]|uniref:Uncharacterized protein n=1 Tax=Caerostris extrusa TaxID=172846 RepID=A0AAV4P1I8_CAEEX|nr:hypothetical protein CEXT_346721 [Caerostris extrusa]
MTFQVTYAVTKSFVNSILNSQRGRFQNQNPHRKTNFVSLPEGWYKSGNSLVPMVTNLDPTATKSPQRLQQHGNLKPVFTKMIFVLLPLLKFSFIALQPNMTWCMAWQFRCKPES